ncbi:conserved Plasmodium protein, unknown function [Plasmodium vinckei lentum]|uniref:Uncharacterized protein n=1 Tax=Plasmodium vinckei lentum TaxID=138297 RepID=A0A6V7SNS8_PLAVN|nr:conserved Plasmodium protein, unknown function [Plasmodium vinckei lentum]
MSEFLEDLEYIKNKKLNEIFERLLGCIYFKKPQNIVEAIIQEVDKLEKEKHVKNVFDAEDIKSMYNFLNVENNKYMTKEKCILGLSQFVLTTKQKEHIEKTEIEDNVDFKMFTSHVLDTNLI